MGHACQRVRANLSWRILLALLCVLLVAALGALQVAHTHAGTANHADCALCAAAHISVHTVSAAVCAPTTSVIALQMALPPSILRSALATFALFTRPPPAV